MAANNGSPGSSKIKRSQARRGGARDWNRRAFLNATAITTVGLGASGIPTFGAESNRSAPALTVADLPRGNAPAPVTALHFPSRLCAFVWRNWQLVPLERMARVIGARPEEVLHLGTLMGLVKPPEITADQVRRSYITVIRRNWHLLPYEQLLELLGWSAEKMAFTLREDDFLLVKLGRSKPQCDPIRYMAPDETVIGQIREMARVIASEFPGGAGQIEEPLFSFVRALSARPVAAAVQRRTASAFSPRFCSSYFALYGDPLLDKESDPYPDGYLARLAEAGVNGVWLQGVLQKLAPFPWEPGRSEHYRERLQNLRALVNRARKFGIGIYLYLNEPRAMPLEFFATHPDLKGVPVGDGHAALCTSTPAVQKYLVDSAALICRAAPTLAGIFTITASENPTNCWSHRKGAECPRCGQRSAAEVIAEVNTLIQRGIESVGSTAQLIAWDWGWEESSAREIIERLPAGATLMSVSEWSILIQRGGVQSEVGEYSISEIGPGPRAMKHWGLASKRGLKTIAKIQAGNTWELSATPYIPALENVARHAANLRQAGVNGLMLGWTLGGYPSPNLEVVTEIGKSPTVTPSQAMEIVAGRRYGPALGTEVVKGWHSFSEAFHEFPFHISLVYRAPIQFGPANLLWGEPTKFASTMIGFPYDDLKGWRAVFPAKTFIAQFDAVANGFDAALAKLREAGAGSAFDKSSPAQRDAFTAEMRVAESAAIHFRSTANQARFVSARDALAAAKNAQTGRPLIDNLESTLKDEIHLARRMHELQCRDSRLGFESSNQYYYVPIDLAEKVLNCRHLLEVWLPAQRARVGV
jgi:hypothetical protein